MGIVLDKYQNLVTENSFSKEDQSCVKQNTSKEIDDVLENNNCSKKNFLANFLEKAKQEFEAIDFNNWFINLKIYCLSANEVIFLAPSKFSRDWIKREFLENLYSKSKQDKTINKIVKSLNPAIKNVAIIHIPDQQKSESKEGDNKIDAKITNLSKYDNVFSFGSDLNNKFTFENFIIGRFNRLAYSMARIAAGFKEEQLSLFGEAIPLYLHGAVGMGKTHLAQAIAWHIKESDKSKKVVYLSAEKFMYHFVKSIRSNEIMDFKDQFRSIDVLIIDDIQFIAGKEGTQAEFMQSFNNLVESNKQVVLVCDRPPTELEAIDEKLKSRISGGMVVNLKTPDYQDRLAILKSKSQLYGQEINDKILEYLAAKITTNVRDLDGALRKLLANKIFTDEEITLESAKTLLVDYFKSSSNLAVNIAKIQKLTAAYFEIKISDLTSSSRLRNIARPRQIAMYLAKNLTNETLPKIGLEFGGKNHATVIHAIKTIGNLMVEDSKLAKDIRILEDRIKN
jgi:chromosomal replication initiator protein